MLLDQLQSDLARAQKERDQLKVDTLRFLLGAVFNYQIEKYPPSRGGSLTDSDVQAVIAKQIKTHKESIDMFAKGKREDLVTREKTELAILESYMPKQMSEEKIREKIEEIRKNNLTADFGTLMKLAMGELKGKADGAVIVGLLKELKLPK